MTAPEDFQASGITPIGEVTWRSQVIVQGQVHSMRVRPWADSVASLELTLTDETGGLMIVFLGRRQIGGIELGTKLIAEGTVVENRGRLAIINPAYRLLPDEPLEQPSPISDRSGRLSWKKLRLSD